MNDEHDKTTYKRLRKYIKRVETAISDIDHRIGAAEMGEICMRCVPNDAGTPHLSTSYFHI